MATRPRVHVYGFPGDVGGANTELWHTLKLWRSLAVPVTLYPIHSPPAVWLGRVKAIGCEVDDVGSPPPHSIVVGFCNSGFRKDSENLRRSGCQRIGVPCMIFPEPEERPRLIYDRYVFQSEYQRSKWLRRLTRLGLPEKHALLIRGAFDVASFPFQPLPHAWGEPFIVGRLSRAYGEPGHQPALDKFPRDLWQQYEAIPHRPIKARVMGWSAELEQHCGKPPEWAECLPQGAETSREFLSKIHCLAPGIGCCEENWPRVGLEAMAAGVPIVAENKAGWKEMAASVGHGVRTIEEQSLLIDAMASDETLRIQWAKVKREECLMLTGPATIGHKWLGLFEELKPLLKGRSNG